MPAVLIVEDDALLRTALGRLAGRSRSDVRLLFAGNGAEALRLLASEDVDVVVTDIIMPVMDGLELIQHMRREHPGVRVVAMSGGGKHVNTDVLTCSRFLGVDEVLEKPFEPEDLLRLLPGGDDAAA